MRDAREGEEPIQIGRLQRYSVDYVLERNISLLHAGAPNGKRVACIGSGPASLACATELVKFGYEVTLFDRNGLPGGLNTHGIAAYKELDVLDELQAATIGGLIDGTLTLTSDELTGQEE